MSNPVRSLAVAVVGLAGLLLNGCAAKPPPPPPASPPQQFIAHLRAAADVNPDGSGRPSPLVVRVYVLKQDQGFKAAELFALYDKEKETLAADLLASQEFELKPGESRDYTFTALPQARSFAVLAAYRDLRNAQWRATYDVAPPADGKAVSKIPKVDLDVLLGRTSVAISIGH
jgi:type VI secretion system protein VasD